MSNDVNAPEAASAVSPLAAHLRLDWKRVLILAGLGILTIVLLLTLSGGWEAVNVLAQVDGRLIALAVVIHYGGFAVRGWRWQQLLVLQGHRLRWRYVTGLLLSGWFVSALVPARAGDALRVAVLRLPTADRLAVPVADGLGSIVLERALDILAILTLGFAFSISLLQGQLPGWVLGAYAVGAIFLLLFGLALLLAPTLLNRLRTWSTHRYWQTALDFIRHLVNSLRVLGNHPWRAGSLLVASFAIWLCDALLMWLAIRSLGELISFGSAAFIALTVDVFATVPLTPGGIGQIEAANAALLALLSLPQAVIAAAVLVNRAISYWSFLLVSGVVTAFMGLGQWHQREK